MFRLRFYAARDETLYPVYPSDAVEEQQTSTVKESFGEEDGGVPLLPFAVVSCRCALLDVNNPLIYNAYLCIRGNGRCFLSPLAVTS